MVIKPNDRVRLASGQLGFAIECVGEPDCWLVQIEDEPITRAATVAEVLPPLAGIEIENVLQTNLRVNDTVTTPHGEAVIIEVTPLTVKVQRADATVAEYLFEQVARV